MVGKIIQLMIKAMFLVKEEIYEVEHRANSCYERRKAKVDYFNDRY